MSAYAHPVANVYAIVYADVHNTYLAYTPAYAWCSTNPCRNACILFAKNVHVLVHARLCNGAEASLPWKLLLIYRECCTNIVQAVVCRPPLLSRPNQSPDAVRSKNPSKSMLPRDAVATAVSHKHHSIICVGAGLIQFVYGLHSKRGHGFNPSQRFESRVFNEN